MVGNGDQGELDHLLIGAGESPPDERISFRDPIARFGDAAVQRLNSPDWIGDPAYAAFAIRTIAHAANHGAEQAIPVLRAALEFVPTDALRRDIVFELTRLGATLAPLRRTKATGAISVAPMGVGDLIVDRCYQRRALHLAGLGGNWQKGISYPADGTHCLLFSDPATASSYGYRDAPVGHDRYRYYGEWSGPGDMVMSGGNRAIVDRSPELYLFTDAACGRVFRGRFECTSWSYAMTVRDGNELRAIVFELRRVS